MQMIDAWEAAPKERRIGPLGTSRFNTRIDYIYLSSALDGAVRACEHCVAMPLVSDHNMVKATIDLKHKMGAEEKRERKKKRDAAGAEEGRAASSAPEPPAARRRCWRSRR